MEKVFWQIYENVYDSILLRLNPYHELLKRALAAMQPLNTGPYFDAGCGTGNFMQLLAISSPGALIYGADFSPAMLSRAERKISAYQERVKLVEHDLNTDLVFDDATFVGISCLNVLYAVGNRQLLVGELARILKTGGKLVLTTPISEPKIGPIVKEHLDDLKSKYPSTWLPRFLGQLFALLLPTSAFISINLLIKKKKNYCFFNKEELSSLIESCGFKIASIDRVYGDQNWLLVATKL